MNASSFLILGGTTVLGVSVLFITIQYGMNISDEYASRLSVTSNEYLKLRAKAIALGEDASNIRNNSARSKRPSTYDNSLAVGRSSPYLRADSDHYLDEVISGATGVVDAVKEGKPVVGGLGFNPAENSDKAVAAKAGLSQEQLYDLMDVVREKERLEASKPQEPTEVTEQSLSEKTVAKRLAERETELDRSTLKNPLTTVLPILMTKSDNSPLLMLEEEGEPTRNDVYTVHDEIRHQLATEQMSDEKRAMMESLLPKEKPKAVRAVNVILKFDTNNCVVPRNSNSLIGVMFRHESQAIRGSSLNDLDELILMRERCDGQLLVEDHAEAVSQKDIKLRESRRDEVKYYLLRRNVPVESIVLSSL